MTFSRSLALLGGIVLPILETTRRWRELGDLSMLPAWIDDWLIGAFLLYGWWRARGDAVAGRPVLAAAWGFACGAAYLSLTGTLMELSRPDPSGLASETIAIIKGLMLIVAVAAMVGALRVPRKE